MPLGKYPNFASCIRDQMKKGYTKEQAGGICGMIEKRHKAKHNLGELTMTEHNSMEDCMKAMMTKGHSEEEAHKICMAKKMQEEDEEDAYDEDDSSEEEMDSFLGIFLNKKISYKERKDLPKSSFAIPGKRKYPIHDKSHARNALARVSAFGSSDEKKQVRNAVYGRYPELKPNKELSEFDNLMRILNEIDN